MSLAWVYPPTLFLITLGFAGVLGDLIYRLRANLNLPMLVAALSTLFLVLFPPLSLPPAFQYAGWIGAVLVILVFALRPDNLPSTFFTRRFALRYAALIMLLSALWGIFNATFPTNLLAAAALLAALLAWTRSEK